MRRKGVRRLLGLERCEALAELDLSGNLIERVEGLERAVKLRKLVLCGNRLRSVEGLECCVSLEHLLLQGNALEDLSCVAGEEAAGHEKRSSGFCDGKCQL